MADALGQIKTIYGVWGRHPAWYKLACVVTFLGRERALRKRAVARLGLKAGDTVLDLACGTGLNFEHLENAVGPQGHIIGFDYSPAMLDSAKKRAGKQGWDNITFVQGDAANLQLPQKVEGVLSTLGISAIPNYREALRCTVDILKDGGHIAILDAKLPRGMWRVFNPVIALVYRFGAGWDHTKDISGELARMIGKVERESFNGGTIYIISGIKREV